MDRFGYGTLYSGVAGPSLSITETTECLSFKYRTKVTVASCTKMVIMVH
jgi:hypothetical protein